MTIRRKLSLLLILLLLLGLLLALAISAISRLSGRAASNDSRASKILRETFEFSIVSQDYLLDHSDRSLFQMLQKQRKLSELLAASEEMLQEYPANRSRLLFLSGKVADRLNRLHEYHLRHNLGASAFVYHKDLVLDHRIEELSRLLSVSVLEIAAQAQQLEELYAARQNRLFAMVQQVVALSFLLLLLLFGLFMFMIRRTVAGSVQQLHTAALAITNGSFDVQVPETGSNELTEVAQAFNRMSTALKLSHHDLLTRNHLLEQETKMRRTAETSLKEANTYLEQRIEQRTRQLSETLELLHRFIHNSPIYAYIKEVSDSDSIVLHASENFVEMIGISGSDMQGKSVRDLFPEPFAVKVIADDQAVVAAGEVLRLEEGLNGRSYVTYRFPLQHNEKRLVAGYTIDVTERKQAEQTVHDVHAQLLQNEKLASIGQLAAGIAHEINNPMGFINSNLSTLDKYIDKFKQYIQELEQQLQQYGNQEQQQKVTALRTRLKLDYVLRDVTLMLHESREGAERVMKIVQDLKTFARSDMQQVAPANINQCLDSTISIIWNQIKYVAELVRDYGELPKVPCNIQQLNQVILNLLVNAIHAIEAGQQEGLGTITIKTWIDGQQACIAVSDTGCGIPEEVRRRIFDPFFTTKEVGKGTGLGLSISHEIIRKHGGELTVVSEVGNGTTFTIRLPLIAAPETPRED
jgi:PAS domain S-box-containing protein